VKVVAVAKKTGEIQLDGFLAASLLKRRTKSREQAKEQRAEEEELPGRRGRLDWISISIHFPLLLSINEGNVGQTSLRRNQKRTAMLAEFSSRKMLNSAFRHSALLRLP
jgi:hypothetical protein